MLDLIKISKSEVFLTFILKNHETSHKKSQGSNFKVDHRPWSELYIGVSSIVVLGISRCVGFVTQI